MLHAKGDALEEDIHSQMFEMRVHGVFCDAFIKIPEENIRLSVHRNVMACCSHYFRSLFTLGWKETKQNEIIIQNISSSTMDEIIRYAYLRQANVNAENVEDLLAAADRFHVFGLQRECAKFLFNQLAPENCIGISKFLRFYNCMHFAEKSWKYILTNFRSIVENSQEFLQLDLEEFVELVSNDGLSVSNESDVFDAIRRWIAYDYKKRKTAYPVLLRKLRFAYMDPDFFYNTLMKSEVKKFHSCASILSAARKVINLASEDFDTDLDDVDDTFLRPRVPVQILFTVGGWSSKGVVNTVETYDRNVDRWFDTCPAMSSARAYHGTVSMNDKIYIVGGFDGQRYLSSMMCFNPETRAWEERAPMYMCRCYVSAVALLGFIYSCGGFDGRQRHSSVERYDPARNQWTMIQPMLRQRSDAGSTTLDGKLYIAGGFDGHTCLDSMETYDPKTGQWTLLQSMLSRRSGVVLITLRRDVIAMGGYDGFRRLETVEVYNTHNRNWSFLSSMLLGRSNFAAVLLDGKVVVIGGYDGETTSGEVEMYDSQKKSWSQLSSLNVGRSAVSACVLTDVKNAADFTYHGLTGSPIIDIDDSDTVLSVV